MADQSPDTTDKVETSIKERLKYVNYLLVAVVAFVYMFGRQVLEIVNDYNSIKAIPKLEKNVEKLEDRLRAADDRSLQNRKDIDEIQLKVLPRIPAWTIDVKRGGS